MIVLNSVYKEDQVLVNLEFLNKFVVTCLPELYLFSRLRLFASTRGGSYLGFQFSKNEKYNVLPNLTSLGWVNSKESRVVKYRNMLKTLGVQTNVSFSIDRFILTSLKTFRAFILAVNEKYLLDKKSQKTEILDLVKSGKSAGRPNFYRKLSGSSLKLLKTNKVKEDGITTITGRVFNVELSRIMGISIPTISRWRRDSQEEGFNSYDFKTIVLNPRSPSRNSFVEMFKERVEKKSFFIAKEDGKSKVTKDLVITSDIELFYVKDRGRNSFNNLKIKSA